MARRSDRWVTPGVVIALILTGGLVVLAVVAAVTYLTAMRLDPDPMLRLVANVTAAVGSVGTFVVQIVTRRTQTNVERKVGQLEPAVLDALDELDAVRGRHAAAVVSIDPATRPHPLLGQGNGPRPPGESGADQSARTQGGGRSGASGGCAMTAP